MTEQRGLYPKYTIINNDTGKEVDGWYFVLKPEKDPAALVALQAYAEATENMELKRDLLEFLQEIES